MATPKKTKTVIKRPAAPTPTKKTARGNDWKGMALDAAERIKVLEEQVGQYRKDLTATREHNLAMLKDKNEELRETRADLEATKSREMILAGKVDDLQAKLDGAIRSDKRTYDLLVQANTRYETAQDLITRLGKGLGK